MDKSRIYGNNEPASKRIVNLSSNYYIVKQGENDVKVASYQTIKELERLLLLLTDRVTKLESELKKTKADNDRIRQYVNKHDQQLSESRYDD